MNDNTLITGGTGLVGSAISGGIKLSSKDGDLRRWNETLGIFKEHKPDKVIHCAGKVGGLGGNMNHKGVFFYDNIMINTNVIEAARVVGVKKLVCFLSTCVFPDDVEYPLSEEKVHLGEPHFSNYPYAYAKRMADIQIRAYREQYGIEYVTVIPTNIYGPNDNFDIKNGHVLPSLIHKCYLAQQNNTDFVIWGTGKPLREFIYSKDIARLVEWAINNYSDNEPIILSTSNPVSIKDMVDLIVEYMNFKGNVIWDKDKPDGQYRKPSSIAKLKSYLPDFQFTSVEDGLRETVEWFYKNYNTIRK
jgi:GDP-L-fucose synthase|tara:strand:- start:1312 stop:2220 length:909 start_codon:yes stop_codon:yes gene_type:complete